MKFTIIIGLFLGIAFVHTAPADDPDAEACKKLARRYFGKMNKIAVDCHAEVKKDAKSVEEIFEKIGCTLKCVLKADKMIDDNDMVTDDIIKAAAKDTDHVTPKYQDKLLGKFMECKTNHSEKLDKNDATCLSYKKYGLCMQDALSHVCYE